MKRLVFERTFECAADTLFERATSEEHVLAARAATGASDVKVVERRVDGDLLHLVFREAQQPDLPGFAKKVLPARVTVTQTEEWSIKRRSATWKNEAAGVPMVVAGTIEIADAGADKALYRLVAEIVVKVPLVGGKVESYATGLLESELTKQADFTASYISGGAG